MAENEKKVAELDEKALAEAQRKRGEAIGSQELDDEALDQVAGGEDCSTTTWCDFNASHCSTQTACDWEWSCTINYASRSKCMQYGQ